MTTAPRPPRHSPPSKSASVSSEDQGYAAQSVSSQNETSAPLLTAVSTPRRRVMQGIGAGAAALSWGTLHPHSARAEQAAATTQNQAPQTPRPPTRFFTPAELAFLTAACERLFPEDDMGPGATALGVPDFIDGQMNTPWGRGEKWFMAAPHRSGPANLGYQLPYSPQQIYRKGITAVQAWVMQNHHAAFENLPAATQDAILSALEHNVTQFDDLPANAFFEQLRSDTIEGAFSDPIHLGNQHMGGWKMMGFPGARADYMDWVDRYETPYPYGPVSINGETG